MNISRESTAYHEAGHAVIACLRHRSFKYATIIADDVEHTLGHVLFAPWKDFQPDAEVSSQTAKRIEDAVVSLLAGGIAESAFSGQSVDAETTANDDEAVAALVSYLFGDSPTQQKYIDYLTEATEVAVRIPETRVAISRVATKLLAHGTVKAAAVRKVVRRSSGLSAEWDAAQVAFLSWSEARNRNHT